VFEGCDVKADTASQEPEYGLELVLRKWYPVDSGRELRCFVRDNALLGETIISCWLIYICIVRLFAARYKLLRVLEPAGDKRKSDHYC
jgi:hypothetical protein